MSDFVIYARKSSESEDRQALSIPSQIQELRTLAARCGVTVAEEIVEAQSAKAPGRPKFGELMRRVRAGKVRGILAWKMDRLARNHFDTGVVLQALSEGTLERIITIDRTYTQDGNDRFIGNFEFGMATKYIDDLRANTKRGLRAKYQQGWKSAVPPLGYLNDTQNKTVVVDPVRFPLVRRMWDLFLSGGFRPVAIVRLANREWGFTTRTFKRRGDRPLHPGMIYKMFRNPFYMGLIRLRTGEEFPGAHAPMVSREEFQRAQEILGRNGRPRPKRHEFAFTGLIRCGTCGGFVTAAEHKKQSGRKYVYYQCGHRKADRPCREPGVRVEVLETQIAAVLSRLEVPVGVLAMLRRIVDRVTDSEQQARESARRALESTLTSVHGEKDRLLDLRLRNLIDEETFAVKRDAIEQRRIACEGKLRIGLPAQELTRRVFETLEFARTLPERFRAGTVVQQRVILEAVGLNPTLTSKKLALPLKNPYDAMVRDASSCSYARMWEDVRNYLLNTTEYFALPDLDSVSHECTFSRHR